jgi:hypothetical protein
MGFPLLVLKMRAGTHERLNDFYEELRDYSPLSRGFTQASGREFNALASMKSFGSRPVSVPLIGKRIAAESRLDTHPIGAERFVPTPIPFQSTKPKGKPKKKLRETRPKAKIVAAPKPQKPAILTNIAKYVEMPKEKPKEKPRAPPKAAWKPRAKSTLPNASAQPKSSSSLAPQASYTPTKNSKFAVEELVRQSLLKEKDRKQQAKQQNAQQSQSIDRRRSVLHSHNLKIRQDNQKYKQATTPNKFAWGVDQTKFRTDERARLELSTRKEQKQQERARAHSAGKARIGLDVLTEIKNELAVGTRSKTSAGRYTEDLRYTAPSRESRRPKADVLEFMRSRQDNMKIKQQRDLLEEQVREAKRLSQLSRLHNQEKLRLTKFKKKKQAKPRKPKAKQPARRGREVVPKRSEDLEVLNLVKELDEFGSTFEKESSRILGDLTDPDDVDAASAEVQQILKGYQRQPPTRTQHRAEISDSFSSLVSEKEDESINLSTESIAKRKDEVRRKVSDLLRRVDQTKELFTEGHKFSSISSVASLSLPVVAQQEFVDRLQQEASIKIQALVRRFLVRCRLEAYTVEDSQSDDRSFQQSLDEAAYHTQESADSQKTIVTAEREPMERDRAALELSLPKQFRSKDKHQHMLLEELSSMKEREAELEEVINYQRAVLQERQQEELSRKHQIFEELRSLKDREMQIVKQVADKSGSKALAGVFAEFISKRYQHLELLFKENREALQAEFEDSESEWIEANLGSRGKRGSYEKIELLLDKLMPEPKQKAEGLITIQSKPLSASLKPPKKQLNLELDLDDDIESYEGSNYESPSIPTDRYLAQFSQRSQVSSSQRSADFQARLCDVFMTDSEGEVERLVSDLSVEFSEPSERSAVSAVIRDHVTAPEATSVFSILSARPGLFTVPHSCNLAGSSDHMSNCLCILNRPLGTVDEDHEPQVPRIPLEAADALPEVTEGLTEMVVDVLLQVELRLLVVEEVAMAKHSIYTENQRLSNLITEEVLIELLRAELDLTPGLHSVAEVPQLPIPQLRNRLSFGTLSSGLGVDTSAEAIVTYVQEILKSLEPDEIAGLVSRIESPAKDWRRELENIENDLPEEVVDFHSITSPIPIQVYLRLARSVNNISTDRDSQVKLTDREAEHIHNKLIFDSLNEALLKAHLPRDLPPWVSSVGRLSKAAPHISAVFEGVSETVTDWSLIEAGKIPTFEMLLSSGRIDEELLSHQRETRLTNMIYNELLEEEGRWVDYSYEEAQTKLDLADLVLTKLIDEVIELLA